MTGVVVGAGEEEEGEGEAGLRKEGRENEGVESAAAELFFPLRMATMDLILSLIAWFSFDSKACSKHPKGRVTEGGRRMCEGICEEERTRVSQDHQKMRKIRL